MTGFTILVVPTAILLVPCSYILPYSGVRFELLEKLGQCGIWGRLRDVPTQVRFQTGPNHSDLVKRIHDLSRSGMANDFLGKSTGSSFIPDISISVRERLKVPLVTELGVAGSSETVLSLRGSSGQALLPYHLQALSAVVAVWKRRI